MHSVRLTGVTERDIDLLLAEEFLASAAFRRWFLKEIGQDPSASFRAIHHSVNASNGESDLILEINHGARRVGVLIENKVDAAFQPRQAARYRARAASYRRSGEYSQVITVIACPSAYGGNAKETLGFDRRLSYESVQTWYAARKDLGNRVGFKRSLLQGAIDRCTKGWTLIPDKKVTKFWRDYWTLVEGIAPELNMKRPDNKPSISGFIYFRPNVLSTGVSLIHKVPYGKVDLQFAGFGRKIGLLEKRFKHLLAGKMHILPAAKSGVVSISVPAMDLSAPLDRAKARKAIVAAVKLSRWYGTVAE